MKLVDVFPEPLLASERPVANLARPAFTLVYHQHVLQHVAPRRELLAALIAARRSPARLRPVGARLSPVAATADLRLGPAVPSWRLAVRAEHVLAETAGGLERAAALQAFELLVHLGAVIGETFAPPILLTAVVARVRGAAVRRPDVPVEVRNAGERLAADVAVRRRGVGAAAFVRRLRHGVGEDDSTFGAPEAVVDDLRVELKRVDARESLVAPVARDAPREVCGLDVSRQIARRRASLLAHGACQPPQPVLAPLVVVGPRRRRLFDGDRDRWYPTAPGAAADRILRWIQVAFSVHGMLNGASRTPHPVVALVGTIARRRRRRNFQYVSLMTNCCVTELLCKHKANTLKTTSHKRLLTIS